MLEAQHSSVDLADKRMLFGQFVGEWDLEWSGNDVNGSPTTVLGELSMWWILDGSALQDVWRVPVEELDRSRMRAFHGTTIRFYDPSLDAWRSTWIDPLNGRVRRFVGRVRDGMIVLEGMDDDPKERWTFRDITADSFVWRGESSTDGGRTWFVEDEMRATRRAPTTASAFIVDSISTADATDAIAPGPAAQVVQQSLRLQIRGAPHARRRRRSAPWSAGTTSRSQLRIVCRSQGQNTLGYPVQFPSGADAPPGKRRCGIVSSLPRGRRVQWQGKGRYARVWAD